MYIWLHNTSEMFFKIRSNYILFYISHIDNMKTKIRCLIVMKLSMMKISEKHN